MHPRRFDTLTRALTDGTTRRGALAAVLGATLGPLGLAIVGREEIAAKKRKRRSGPRIARQSKTQAFSNAALITIGDNSPAAPYPSQIVAGGFANGAITHLTLTLHGFTHQFPTDVNLLLGRAGLDRSALLMNEVSNGTAVSQLEVVLDDAAAPPLPNLTPLTSGVFRPADYGGGEVFPPPAPASSGPVALSAFNGADPNGTWQLWVFDDSAPSAGQIGGGWSLQITATVDVAVPASGKKKKKGRR